MPNININPDIDERIDAASQRDVSIGGTAGGRSASDAVRDLAGNSGAPRAAASTGAVSSSVLGRVTDAARDAINAARSRERQMPAAATTSSVATAASPIEGRASAASRRDVSASPVAGVSVEAGVSPASMPRVSAVSAGPAATVSPRIEQVDAEDVAGSEEPFESQPMTSSETTGFVSPQLGVVTETSPERESVPSGVANVEFAAPAAGTPASPASPASRRVAVDAMPQIAYSHRDEDPATDSASGGSSGNGVRREGRGRSRSRGSGNADAGSDQAREQDAGAMKHVGIWGYGDQWEQIPEKVARKGSKAVGKYLERLEKKLNKKAYSRVREDEGTPNVDEYWRSTDDLTFERYGDDEKLFQRALARSRNAILRRFVNPSLLHIEGERVEMKSEDVGGRTVTYARRTYSPMVLESIGAVKGMYNCSTRAVMQLVQLRAGLGVASDGTIAHVDPDSFRLTEDQFYELCRDIVASQEANGHPLGSVEGRPGGSGVRDDTGKYVVVAKTRCFPLGYMPNQLLQSLMADPVSPLHPSRSGMTAGQIQAAIGDEWMKVTYPTLCANTGGNLMFQARAIENMMRGLMMADGMNPSDLGIPEIQVRKTLMALEAEAQSITDPELNKGRVPKRIRYEQDLSRIVHKYRKTPRSRAAKDGRIDSAASRRWRGDFFDRLSKLEMAAKAANIGVMISAVPENIVAEGMMSLAYHMSKATFDAFHGDIAADYEFTDDLRRASESREAVEARDVAESLYRIGGHALINAYFAELDDSGHMVNRLTRSDLRGFLQRVGITGDNPSVSDAIRNALHIDPKQDRGFLSNASRIVDGLNDIMLSSNLFKKRESRQFVQMSMAEMARSAVHGRESYTSSQIENWSLGEDGGEELIRSLLQTDAGREAFMTQGITSLGRKSPIEHGMRLALAKNGLTQAAVRTMFDRFPEYGVNKLIQQVPFSNTINYLGAYGISGVGDLLGSENLSRVSEYAAGSRMSFIEGLRKNLMYDTIMGAEKLMIGALYAGILVYLGGVHPPEDKELVGNWSEWVVGDDEDAVPIKWAWWMDDLSGIGLPLGIAWAICEQGDWSPESKDTATMVFINAVASLNSGTAVFDFIDLVNNFDQEADHALGLDVEGYEYDRDEWLMTLLEQGLWDIVGDLTPTFIGQLVPWSKDYIGPRDNTDAHTASRVYDVGEGSQYTMEQAQEEYRTRRTGSYSDYVRRRSAQTNIIQALVYDAFKSDTTTGYKYTEQPLDTMVDPYVWAMWEKFDIDLDPATSTLYGDIDAQSAYADSVIQHIASNYSNPYEASLDGFALSPEARTVCIDYCYRMIDEAQDEFDRKTEEWLPDDEYDRAWDELDDRKDFYYGLINDYFRNYEAIPARPARYVRQESDRETIYLDADTGKRPMTWLDQYGPGVQSVARGALDLLGSIPVPGNFLSGGAIGDTQAESSSYAYGNIPSLLPFTSPRTQGKGYNYETPLSWIVTDEDGNPVNDMDRIFANAAGLVGSEGTRYEGQQLQEALWGGQGPHDPSEIDEEMHIAPDGVPTLDRRDWRPMDEIAPEWFRNLDAATATALLGIESSIPDGDDDDDDDDDDEGSGSGSNRRRSGNDYYYGGYSYSGGGSYSEYNPRIYSNSHQVYSSRPSGMSTRQPYSPQRTYLRPGYYTSGSRKPYSRQQ